MNNLERFIWQNIDRLLEKLGRLFEINLEVLSDIYHLMLHEVLVQFPKKHRHGINGTDLNSRKTFEEFMHQIIERQIDDINGRKKQIKEIKARHSNDENKYSFYVETYDIHPHTHNKIYGRNQVATITNLVASRDH